jgi:hypothetical protein
MASGRHVTEEITLCTARIECTLANGEESTGTGFQYQFAKLPDGRELIGLITNKHVVRGAVSGAFHMTLRDSSGNPAYGQHHRVQLDAFETRWIPHPDPDVDLCMLPIGPFINALEAKQVLPFVLSLDESLLPSEDELASLGALEDVLMVGYPNGIWDSVNNQPIMRRGVTATHPRLDYEGRKVFMIDAACFPGSSGSPVFLYSNGGINREGSMFIGLRVKLLGVLYAGPQHTATGQLVVVDVPTVQTPMAISRIPNNLGLVIKAERIRELGAVARQRLGLPAA